MQISKIRIKNFKSFEDVVLELNSLNEPNIVIGKNDSGKSNLLECLNIKKLISNTNEKDSFFDLNKIQEIYFHLKISEEVRKLVENFIFSKENLKLKEEIGNLWIIKFSRKNEDINWKTTISLTGEENINFENVILSDLPIRIRIQLQKFLKEKEKNSDLSIYEENKFLPRNLFFDKKYEYTKILELYDLTLKRINFLKQTIIEKSNFVHIKTSDNLFKLKYSYDWEEFKNQKKLQKFFLSSLSKEEDKNLLKKFFEKKDLKKESFSIVPEYENLLTKVKIMHDDMPVKLDPTIDYKNNQIIFKLKENAGAKYHWFKPEQRGLGFCSSFSLMIEKANLKKINSEKVIRKPSIRNLFLKNRLNPLFKQINWGLFLVDEPETHLHPDRQEKILEQIEQICEKNKVQVVIATHSPHFISRDKFMNTKVLIRRKKGGAKKCKTEVYSNLYEYRKKYEKKKSENENYIKLIESALGLTMRWNFPDKDKRYVLVEGISDYWLLNAIFKAKKNALSFCFYNLDANSKERTIEYCKLLHLPFVVIFDNDRGGLDKIKNLKKRSKVWLQNQEKEIFVTWEKIDETKTNIESFIEFEDQDKFCRLTGKEKEMKINFEKLKETTNKKNWIEKEITEKTRNNFNKMYKMIVDLFEK